MALLEERGLLDRASRGPADRRGDRRAPARRARDGAAGAGGAGRLRQALVARALEASDFVEEPWLERDLRDYFPPAVVERCGHLLGEHPLRRQLLCMINANAVVNALGPTFVSPAGGRARRRAGRRRARVPDRPRGDRRRRAAGRRSSGSSGVDRDGPARADGRRSTRSSRRPRAGISRGRPRRDLDDDDRGRPRRLRAAGRGAARARRPTSGGAAREQTAERLVGRRRARGRSPRAHALRGRAASTRRTWSPSPPRPAARSRTSPGVLRASAPSCGSTGWSASSTRVRLRDADAALGAAGRARGRVPGAPRARRGARCCGARAPIRSWPSSASCTTRAEGARRLDTFLRALSREGEPDLAGLALAVRQLGTLVS